MHISVVIPAYNEERTLRQVVNKVLSCRIPEHQWDIIIVDDGSKDQTLAIARSFETQGVRVFHLPINHGKGSALKKGFAEAKGEVVIIQDADLEYDPTEYPHLLQPFVDGVADVVYGSRFIGSHPHRVLFFWHFVANLGLTILSNMTTNLNLSDMETGSKVIRRELLEKMDLKERGFGVEPEITIKLARLRARFFEVGISYYGRTYAEGKKITWRDGLHAVWCIFRYYLFR